MEMDTVQGVWQRIEVWMRENAPVTWREMAVGANEDELMQVEERLGVSLPEEFKASYRMHNGQFWMYAVSNMKILSLQEIVEMSEMLTQLLEEGTFDDSQPYYFFDPICADWDTGPIQAVWWHAQWIPFGMDRAGNYVCLDLAPDVGGAVGQVIDWDHECGPSRTLFSGFQQLLLNFAERLEAGDYVDTEDGLRLLAKMIR